MTQTFERQMSEKGWFVFPEFVKQDMIDELKTDLKSAYESCRKIQVKNGVEGSVGAGHHMLIFGNSFIKYLEEFEQLDAYAQAYFGGKYIINTFGGNILETGMSYASHVHRDIRSYSAHLPLMLNTIVMLDDFTVGNGATRLMNRGHVISDKPDQEQFDATSFHVTGKAGSVVFFNSNMWHCAGENKTNKPRMALTPVFSRPFIKPQFDYPRALGYDYGHAYSPYVRQLLGYNSRIPSTLKEWYSTDRFYKGDQG